MLALSGRGRCGEDLSCILGSAASAVLLATAGAAGGTCATGRVFGTEPSGWGAVIGALAGAAAAIGVNHLIDEQTATNDGTRTMLFAVTQGSVTAIGSRIGAALR